MTWDARDFGQRLRGTGAQPPRTPAAPPAQVNLDDPDNLPSLPEAMGWGAQDSGSVFGADERFPYEMERELARDFGWIPERNWQVLRRMMFRDTEAI